MEFLWIYIQQAIPKYKTANNIHIIICPNSPLTILRLVFPSIIYDIMYAIAAKDGTMEIRHITT